MKREEGHYTLKRVKELPDRGNSNFIYMITDPNGVTTLHRFLSWKKYELISFSGGSLTFEQETKLDNLPTDQNSINSNKEDNLGNPTSDGQILSSLTDGTRVWIDPSSGEVSLTDLNSSQANQDANIASTYETKIDAQSKADSKEDVLGNPSTDDQILSSKIDGTRVWIDNNSNDSLNSSSFQNVGEENVLGLNVDDDTIQKIVDKLNTFNIESTVPHVQVEQLIYDTQAIQGVSYTHNGINSQSGSPAVDFGTLHIKREYIGNNQAYVTIEFQTEYFQDDANNLEISLPTGTITNLIAPNRRGFRSELNVTAYVLATIGIDKITINRDDNINSDSPTYFRVTGIGNWIGEQPLGFEIPVNIQDEFVLIFGQSNALPTTGNTASAPFISHPTDTRQLSAFGSNIDTLVSATTPLLHPDNDDGNGNQQFAKPNGFDIYLAQNIVNSNPNTRVNFVPSSVAATSIQNQWGIGNPLYNDSVTRGQLIKTLVPSGNYRGIIVFQGEADKDYNNWLNDQIDQVNGWRTAFGNPTLPVVFITGVNRYHEQNPEFGSNVTQAQLRLPNILNYTSVVDQRLYTQQNLRADSVHNGESQQEDIGNAAYSALLRAEQNSDATSNVKTSVPTNLVVIQNGTDIDVSWTETLGSYETFLEYRLNNGDWRHIAISENTDNGLRIGNSYSFSTLPITGLGTYTPVNGDLIEFRVSALVEDNMSDPSVMVGITYSITSIVGDSWVFNAANETANGYVGINGGELTTIGTITKNPNSVTIPGGLNALVSPYEEEDTLTVYGIMEVSQLDAILFGTFSTTGDLGITAFWEASDNSFRVNGQGGGNPFPSTNVFQVPTTGVNWVFAGFSYNSAGDWTLFLGRDIDSNNNHIFISGNGTRITATHGRNVSLGNESFNSSGFFNDKTWKQFAIEQNFKSIQNEWEQLYNNALSVEPNLF